MNAHRLARLARATSLLGLWSLLATGCIASPSAPVQWDSEVQITSSPPGARIVWFRPALPDGTPGGPEEIGTTPMTWTPSRMLLGDAEEARLVLFKDGHGRHEVVVPVAALQAGEPIEVSIPQFATLGVRSDPTAHFTLTDEGGIPVATDEYSPRELVELNPGTYTIRFERPGYAPLERSLTLRAGEQGAVNETMEALPEAPLGDGRMSIRALATEGSVDEIAFYDALRIRARDIAGCYDRVLASDPTASGQVHLRLTVHHGFGRVESAEVTQTEITHADTLECVQRRVKNIELTASGEGTSTVDLALRFHHVGE